MYTALPIRRQAKPVEPRSKLSLNRGFLCWQDASRTSYYPLILKVSFVTCLLYRKKA